MVHITQTPHDRSPEWIWDFFTLPTPRGRGWRTYGYWGMIDGKGELIVSLQNGQEYTHERRTNGTRPWRGVTNSNTLHIAVIAGMQMYDILDAQERTLKIVLELLLEMYPDAKFLGHNQVASKYCPMFSMPKYLRKIGFPERNISKLDRYGYAKRFDSI